MRDYWLTQELRKALVFACIKATLIANTVRLLSTDHFLPTHPLRSIPTI